MAQEQPNTPPVSGLLIGVEPLTTAVDRGKANGAVADDDGSDG